MSIKKYVGTKKAFTDVSQIIDFIFEDEEEKGDVDSDMEVEIGDDDNVNNIENTSDLEYEEETISATCTSHSNANVVDGDFLLEKKLSGTLEISSGHLAVPLLSSTVADISSETEEEIILDEEHDGNSSDDFLPKPHNFIQKKGARICGGYNNSRKSLRMRGGHLCRDLSYNDNNNIDDILREVERSDNENNSNIDDILPIPEVDIADVENVPVMQRGRGRGHGRGNIVDHLGANIVQGRGFVDNVEILPQDLEWSRCDSWLEENDDMITVPEFTEFEGVAVRLPDNPKVMEFFNLYLTNEIFQLIVDEMNRFADQYFDEHPESVNSTYLQEWEPVTLLEIKIFVALVILMGIAHKPSIPMYWSTDALYNTSIFSQCMKRTRFQLILKFLHFNNNDNYDRQDDDRDRLHKLRPFLELVRERCKKVYSPGKELSVDDSLILFKGRLAFKQFIRTKRARFGIKL